jgi:GTP-binding protein HflX
LIGVDLPSRDHKVPLDYSLEELERLAETAGALVVHKYSQQVRRVTPATLIGRGKVDEVHSGLQEHHANLVILDEDLSPAQQRNLENALNTRVVDRSQLILDIFAKRCAQQRRQAAGGVGAVGILAASIDASVDPLVALGRRHWYPRAG